MRFTTLPLRLALAAAVFAISVYGSAGAYVALDLHDTYVAPLIAAQERTQRLTQIANLRVQSQTDQLYMPVWRAQVSEIRDTWSAPRPDYRTHEGQDIFAASGTPVLSATAGYVTRVQRDSADGLGGKTVTIIGAGGFSYYYAHLSRIPEYLNELDRVGSTSVIGFVGNSGNASTTPPHLHFSMYAPGWRAINPLPLLEDRVDWKLF